MPTTSPTATSATAREAALVALREPSAFYCMRMWDRALQRTVEVARNAGVPGTELDRLTTNLQREAARTGRTRDWVVRQARQVLYQRVEQL